MRIIMNYEIRDDLCANFRSWEYDCDNFKDTNTLAHELMDRHSISFDEAFDIAKHWTGYDEEKTDENN